MKYAFIIAILIINYNTLDRLHSPILRKDLKISNSASCAGSNCHGGRREGEYKFWIEKDPHSLSWVTICSDKSVEIMRRLNIMKGSDIVDHDGFDNCLSCHNSVRRYKEPRTNNSNGNPYGINSFMREGVGCTSCHGPSERWINSHYRLYASTGDGFTGLSNIYVRARVCASCHIGDKNKDLNHDVYAAGHPQLVYNFVDFHNKLPKHWTEYQIDRGTLLLAGEIAKIDSSLALMESRLAKLNSVSQWPEFASHNCGSCHINLGLNNDKERLDLWNRDFIKNQELGNSLDKINDYIKKGPKYKENNKELLNYIIDTRELLSGWFSGSIK